MAGLPLSTCSEVPRSWPCQIDAALTAWAGSSGTAMVGVARLHTTKEKRKQAATSQGARR